MVAVKNGKKSSFSQDYSTMCLISKSLYDRYVAKLREERDMEELSHLEALNGVNINVASRPGTPPTDAEFAQSLTKSLEEEVGPKEIKKVEVPIVQGGKDARVMVELPSTGGRSENLVESAHLIPLPTTGDSSSSSDDDDDRVIKVNEKEREKIELEECLKKIEAYEAAQENEGKPKKNKKKPSESLATTLSLLNKRKSKDDHAWKKSRSLKKKAIRSLLHQEKKRQHQKFDVKKRKWKRQLRQQRASPIANLSLRRAAPAAAGGRGRHGVAAEVASPDMSSGAGGPRAREQQGGADTLSAGTRRLKRPHQSHLEDIDLHPLPPKLPKRSTLQLEKDIEQQPQQSPEVHSSLSSEEEEDKDESYINEVTCDICRKMFSTPYTMKRHRNSMHGVGDVLPSYRKRRGRPLKGSKKKTPSMSEAAHSPGKKKLIRPQRTSATQWKTWL